MDSNNSLLQEAERTLEHQQSLGNLLLQSIDAEWLEQHKDLLDVFIQNPNAPAVLDKLPHGPTPMESSQPVCATTLPPLQLNTDEVESMGRFQMSVQTSDFAADSLLHSQANIVTTGFGDSSPALDTPQKQAADAPGLRSIQTARSDPTHAPAVRSPVSLEGGASAIVPEISLAARAGSLGATSLQSAQRNSAARKSKRTPSRPVTLPQPASPEKQPFNALAPSSAGAGAQLDESAQQTSDSDEMDADALDGEEQPARKGPGRKKRTQPILVETEDGEMKYVTPTEFRKLRRRITNRLSARRMRKKHAEERAMISSTTKQLEDERNYYRHAFEKNKERMEQLELHCQQLAEENRALKRAQWSEAALADRPHATDANQAPPQLSLESYQTGGLGGSLPLDTLRLRPQHRQQQQPPYMTSFAYCDIQCEEEFGGGDALLHPANLSGMPQIPLHGLSTSGQTLPNPAQLSSPGQHPGHAVFQGRPMC